MSLKGIGQRELDMGKRKGRSGWKGRGFVWRSGLGGWLALVLSCAWAMAWPPDARPGEPVRVTILHTNNVKGHLFPCPS